MFADGYEITAMAFAAPELVRLWNIDPASLAPVFSASLIGIFFGAPLLGYVGDRFGRKVAIVAGCVICGVATFAMVLTTSLQHMFVLRLIVGMGIGGLMPNTISLTSELSPRRFRAMLIVLMFTGITLGGGLPSGIAAWLVPLFGWKVLFLIGGLIPLIIASCLFFALPESIKFLALRSDRKDELLRIARKVRPDLSISESTEFRMPRLATVTGIGLKQIYSGGLQWITPLLWFTIAMTLMANYFLNSWMPVLFEQSGLAPDDAALASGLYHVGGTLGGLLISVLIDRYGFIVVAIFLLVAAPVVGAIGIAQSQVALLVLSLSAGICVLGAQFGNNAACGMLYPTEFRAKAVGWALSIGRFGSILGPLAGGYLIGKGWSTNVLFATAATPLLAGAIAAAILTFLCFSRFGNMLLHDRPAEARL
jgi:AAHS family 4-hydroxybenzoate transporter-like MFS transporter